MIKQYILSLEAADEHIIDIFVETLNKQAEATKGITPISIHVEEK